jgi:hypothetical protein
MSAQPEPEIEDSASDSGSDDDGPKLQLADIGTFSARGGEITVRRSATSFAHFLPQLLVPPAAP